MKRKQTYKPTLKDETRELISQGAFYRHKSVMAYVHWLALKDLEKIKTRI